jgi:hypothetical protein
VFRVLERVWIELDVGECGLFESEREKICMAELLVSIARTWGNFTESCGIFCRRVFLLFQIMKPS